MAAADIPIGERIRFYRTAQRRSQAAIAGLALISEEYLSKIERGLKTPTIPTLQRIAQQLGVPVSVLLGEAPTPDPDTVAYPGADAIQAALMHYPPAPASPDAAADLAARVEAAWDIWQGVPARYSTISPLLPDLIRDAQAATLTDTPAAHATACDLYMLLRTVCKRIGRMDLSLLAADRAMNAARQAGDETRILAATWNLGQILLAQGQAEAALDLSIRAAEALEPRLGDLDPEHASLCGALWLNASTAASRMRQHWQARGILREHAEPLARTVPDASNICRTVFGPTNVTLHAIGVEIEAGESGQALRLAEDVDLTAVPSLERRTTCYLQLAAGYEQRHDDMGVLVHLWGAHETGPEDLRYNPLPRNLVRGLLKRSRSTIAPQARRLAREIGVLG